MADDFLKEKYPVMRGIFLIEVSLVSVLSAASETSSASAE